ncbi:MAG: hypothetical protein J6X50_00070 [Bacilli bacterium]|nr:hypothetical protein [Bacilli bacterium]
MNSKRKSALILAVIAAVLFTIIFALPAYTVGPASSSYSYSGSNGSNVSTLTLLNSLTGRDASYTFFTPWLILFLVIIGTALLLGKKTALLGYGLVLGGQGVTLAAMINFYSSYSQNNGYNVQVTFGGVLEYFILFFVILSASLFFKADLEDANNVSYYNSPAPQRPYTSAPAPVVQNQSRLSKDDQDKLKFWKDLLDQELITKEEYDKKKKEILGL